MERPADQSSPVAVLLEKDGRFYFYQPDMGVIASDDRIETAYDKFSSARRGFLKEVESAGLTRGRPFLPWHSEQTETPRSTAGELKMFLAKTCIVLLLVATVGGIAGALVTRSVNGLATAIDQAFTPVKTVSLADVVRKAAEINKDAQSLTKQEKESLQKSIGAIAREIDPFVDAWRNPPPRTP